MVSKVQTVYKVSYDISFSIVGCIELEFTTQKVNIILQSACSDNDGTNLKYFLAKHFTQNTSGEEKLYLMNNN